MAYRYSVAISFLSVDKPIALQIRDRLEGVLRLPVFVYCDRQADLGGKSFEDGLSPIFEAQSRVVAVLYRPAWGKRGGTLVEYRAVTRRRLRSDEQFLFPIIIEPGTSRPPWADDILYFDLSQYGLGDAVNALAARVLQHEQAHPVPADHSCAAEAAKQVDPLVLALNSILRAAFVAAPGPYRGYFADAQTDQYAERWRSRGGEVAAATQAPKRPYYETYWGYEAAIRIVPQAMGTWTPLTLQAISDHFRGGRWLKVVREYAFSSGPRHRPALAESVRHTAKAAELTHLLAPDERRVSEVVWNLINEASVLQHSNGGWMEFRADTRPPALWATIYVHRFLSKLSLCASGSIPDERDSFLSRAAPLLVASEQFLSEQWQEDRWQIEGTVARDEGTAAVLAEIGPFASNESLILDAYDALRSTLNPAGRMATVPDLPGRPSEPILALRLAFGLKSCGRGLAEADPRYHNLVAWLSDALVPDPLATYDIAFAAAVLDLRSEIPSSSPERGKR